MLNKSFDGIQKSDIDALITNEETENKQLEYKRDLPGGTDQEKIEFLADISSFANASGGHIIYGLGEKKNESGQNTGTPEYAGLGSINADEQKGKLEQIIQSGIAPRISGIQIKEIAGFDNGPLIIIRIPKSWAGPHMITLKNCSRFYSRKSNGKYQLDVGEIRMAFVLSETLPERIRQFIIERVQKISVYKTPIELITGPKIVIHMIPFSAFGAERSSILNIESVSYLELPPVGQYSPQTSRYNFDGLLTHDHSATSQYNGYVQLFRNGIIEAVDAYTIHTSIPGIYEVPIMDILQKYLAFQKKRIGTLPVVISLTMVGVGGLNLEWNSNRIGHPIDRDVLLIPEVLAESFDVNLPQLMKSIFDTVWNAAGVARSENYDGNGNWKIESWRISS
jgi:hypothetical protein